MCDVKHTHAVFALTDELREAIAWAIHASRLDTGWRADAAREAFEKLLSDDTGANHV